MKLTIFLLLRATTAWLRLERAERSRIAEEQMGAAFARYESVQMRFFDMEAFTARCSDVMMLECDNLQDYSFLMDELRDSDMFRIPYFEVVDILPGIEESHVVYDESLLRKI